MSKKNGSLFLVSLVPALVVASLLGVANAKEGKSSTKQARWSDRATWPNKKVPVAGEKVTIAAGKEVVLDVTPPALGGLTINGKLSFADNADLELTTEWIMLHGEFEKPNLTHTTPPLHSPMLSKTNS
jgi:G8 domain